jgi:hypothetical protein
MIARPEEGAAARRLADLRDAQPADATLRSLLAVLTTKLDLCARLPVLEWEATSAGDVSCAKAFQRLAESERRSCADVLACLQEHLERCAAVPGASRG